MKMKYLSVVGIVLLGMCSCQQTKKSKKTDVISQRYIHKYGYDVSRDEWSANRYPGQIVTTLKNGVCVASSYEEGLLHGPTSCSYPHSQTLESLQIYEKGNLIKKTTFDIKGIPQKEEVFLTPVHVKTKFWYASGTPMCIEECVSGSIMQGDYFTLQNELDSKVEYGAGVKTIRSQDGLLLSKESIQDGKMISKETFHPNGVPHIIISSIQNGLINGDKKEFSSTGSPILTESYAHGKLNGLCCYYQNGYKYQETLYNHGDKEGIERHYLDGETVIEETEYHENSKHGPSIFYTDGFSKTEWYYNDEFVSRAKFDELTEREKIISIMNERSKPKMYESSDEENLFE
jgi:antitoxin component YwqK of YwqJK toxin-antitoxin module